MTCFIPQLSIDAVMHIQMHLKPRHMLKLMLTCKQAAKILNENEEYWTRVAAHAIFRDCEAMEIVYCFTSPTLDMTEDKINDWKRLLPFHITPGTPSNHGDCVDINFYDLTALDKGYYWTMERFFERLNLMMQIYTEDGKWDWSEYKGLSLKKQTQLYYRINCFQLSGFMPNDKEEFDMKEMAGNAYRTMYTRPNDDAVLDFLHEIDDNPHMPEWCKRQVMRGLKKLFYEIQDAPPAPQSQLSDWGDYRKNEKLRRCILKLLVF